MSVNNENEFQILTTRRLTLRPLRESDANEIFTLRSDEQINKPQTRRACA